jgi:tetratricopeptide (TPR) repeat protein
MNLNLVNNSTSVNNADYVGINKSPISVALTIIIAAVSALGLVALSPAYSAEEDDGLSSVLELPPSDLRTIPPRRVLSVCTDALRGKLPQMLRAKVLVRRGDANFALEQYEEALKDYGQSLKISPKSLDARLGRVKAMIGLDRKKEALDEVKTIISEHSRCAKAHEIASGLYGAIPDYSSCQREASKAIELDPASVGAYQNRAWVYLSQGKPEKCLIDIRRAIELEPLGGQFGGSKGDVYIVQGNALLMLHKNEQALQSFFMARELQPDNPFPWFAVWRTYVNMKKYRLSYGAAKHLVKLVPKMSIGYALKAASLAKMTKYEAAYEAAQQAQKLDPMNPKIHYQLGSISILMAKYKQALKLYEKADRMEPERKSALMGILLILSSCPDASIRDGNKAIDLARKLSRNPKFKNSVLLYISLAQAGMGKYKEAIASMEELMSDPAVESSPYKTFLKACLQRFKMQKPYRLDKDCPLFSVQPDLSP